jgi:hypothetical protein
MGKLEKQLLDTYQSYSGVDIVATVNIPGHGAITIGELQTVSYSTHREKWPVRAIGHTKTKGYTYGPRTVAGNLIFTVFDNHVFYRLLDKQGIENKRILSDELPPFDIIITFGSEYSKKSKMVIKDVTIVDEGQVMSINNMITENQMSFVARDVDLMKPTTEIHHSRTEKREVSNISKSNFETEIKPVQNAGERVPNIDYPVGDITGNITTEEGPLTDTRVKAKSSAHGDIAEVFTNDNGDFKFIDMKVGEWDLMVDKEGFEEYEKVVDVKPDSQTKLNEIFLKFKTQNIQRIEPAYNIVPDKELVACKNETRELGCIAIAKTGSSITATLIEWNVKVFTDNEDLKSIYGNDWMMHDLNKLDNNNVSEAEFTIPEGMKPGDRVLVRARALGEENVNLKPLIFSIDVVEGETIGN